MVVQLNLAKIVTLAPIKLDKKFSKVLKLFAGHNDQDLISCHIIKDKWYSKQQLLEKTLVPNTPEFKFVAIYSRTRGFDSLMRFLTLILFLALKKRLNLRIEGWKEERGALKQALAIHEPGSQNRMTYYNKA